MEAPQGQNTTRFLSQFMQRRREMTHPVPVKAFLQPSPEAAMVFAPFRCTHWATGPYSLIQKGGLVSSGGVKCMPPYRGCTTADKLCEAWNSLATVFSHQQELSLQLYASYCTGTAFCFCAQYDTGFCFDSCHDLSYLPCIYNGHLILVSLFRRFNQTPPGYRLG